MTLLQEDVIVMQRLLDEGWSRIGLNDRGDVSGQADVDCGLLGVVTVSYLVGEANVLVWDKATGRSLVSFSGFGCFADIFRMAKAAILEQLQMQLEELA